MKISVRLLTTVALASLLSSFNCLAQGGARMLPKGGTELSVGYTGLTSLEGEGGLINLLGAGFGYGITQKVNLKFRYSRLFAGDLDGGLNLVSITPKFALKQNKISALLPISVLFAEGGSIWAISPGFQFSAGNSNKSEFTANVRGDIPFSDEVDGALLSATFGGGFSSDLDRWAVRPEIGVLFSTGGGDPVFTFGLGANFALNPPRE